MRQICPLTLPLLATIVTAGCQSPVPEAAPPDTAAVEQEIAAWWSAWEQILLDENVEGMREMVTSDVKLMEPGMDVSGEDFLSLAEEFLGAFDIPELSFESRDVFVHGDVAYQVGQYDETLVGADGETNVANFFFGRWERNADGQWQLDRFVSGPREAPSGM